MRTLTTVLLLIGLLALSSCDGDGESSGALTGLDPAGGVIYPTGDPDDVGLSPTLLDLQGLSDDAIVVIQTRENTITTTWGRIKILMGQG